MRKVLIALVVIVVLFGAALALALRNLDTYLTENRGLVAAELAENLGREVAFESVGMTWAGGFGVRVNGLRVGDDPKFSEEDFLSADVVDVRVKLLPALFGRVEVGRVILRAPRVVVIQTAEGLSTDSLGGGAPGSGAAPAPADGGAAGRPPPALAIALLDMRDGALRFVDRTVKPTATLELDQLDVQASELGLTEPIAFEVEAALFGAGSRNFAASGTVGPVASEVPRMDLDLELDSFALERALEVKLVRELLPEALSGSGPVRVDADVAGTLAELDFDARVDAGGAAVRFGDTIDKPPGERLDVALAGTKRDERVEVPKLRIALGGTEVVGSAQIVLGEPTQVAFDLGSDGVAPADFGVGDAADRLRELSLSGDVALAKGGPRGSVKARSADGRVRGAEYRNLNADVKLRGKRYEIAKVTADAFDGTVELSGSYDLSGSAPRFDIDTRVADARIESVMQMVSGRAARLLNGTVDFSVALDGAGSGWEQIRNVLKGNGQLHVANGVLKDFNPAGDALRALMAIPALTGNRISAVLQKHPKLLGPGDTPIDDLASTFTIQGGWVQVSKLVISTTEYALNGAGRYSLAGELDFKTALIFSEALSQELLTAEPDLRYIRSREGRLELPVALRGSPPKVAVVPDISRLAENVAREAISDAIGDALGIKKPAAEADGSAAPQKPEDVLGGILRDALGQKPAQPAPAPAPAPAPPPAQQETAPPAPVLPQAETPETPEAPQPPTPEDVGAELLRQGIEGLLGGGKQQ